MIAPRKIRIFISGHEAAEVRQDIEIYHFLAIKNRRGAERGGVGWYKAAFVDSFWQHIHPRCICRTEIPPWEEGFFTKIFCIILQKLGTTILHFRDSSYRVLARTLKYANIW